MLTVLPGSKIILKGPIETRRGIYMLKNVNVELKWTNNDPKMIGHCSFNNAEMAILGKKSLYS